MIEWGKDTTSIYYEEELWRDCSFVNKKPKYFHRTSENSVRLDVRVGVIEHKIIDNLVVLKFKKPSTRLFIAAPSPLLS